MSATPPTPAGDWRWPSENLQNPLCSLAAFLNTQPWAEAIKSPDQATDAGYRYRVQLLSGTEPQLQVECWRRKPGRSCWNRRCGPMVLSAFIQRFLPGELQT